jgi:DNA invertase Pin-like site-specific DNA recombinase
MAKKSRAKPKPKVYSYIRFSTPEQAMGDSERRQLELAKEFAARKKLQLDESLRDEGLSGYHGTHRKKGVLGKFLKRIEDGKIPRGSILVVENIDRLGREDVMTALSTIQTIIEHYITIVTLSPYEQEYTRKSINEGLIYQLIGDIKRANAESEMKSKRLRAVREQARKAARETGRLMTSKVPHWVVKNPDGELAPIPEAAACVQRIFELKRQGVGTQTIAKTLNEDHGWSPPPTKKADVEARKPGNGWQASYVRKIVANRAVIGDYQPHVKVEGRRVPEGEPIPDYYPRVIDDELFFAVQKLMQSNRGGGGRKDKCTNLFTDIV